MTKLLLIFALSAFAEKTPNCPVLADLARRYDDQARESIQAKIKASETYSIEAESRDGEPPKVTLFEGEGKKKKKLIELPCIKAFAGIFGMRLECGGYPSVLEVLMDPKDKVGAAVLYYRNHGKLGKKYFSVEVGEHGEIPGFKAQEVKFADVRDENKLVSPIRATISELGLPNAHGVGEPEADGKFKVIRGMFPREEAQVKALHDYGVRRVLVFRDGTKEATAKEKEMFKKLGLKEEDVKVIEFPWKEIKDYEKACHQVLQGVQYLMGAGANLGSTMFHCTVGEDRTGLLSGLYRLINEGGDHYEMFQKEMCERGYENGDPLKPYGPVVLKIRESLTTTYLKLAYQIKAGKITAKNLNAASACGALPSNQTLGRTPGFDIKRFHCHTSSNFRLPK